MRKPLENSAWPNRKIYKVKYLKMKARKLYNNKITKKIINDRKEAMDKK